MDLNGRTARFQAGLFVVLWLVSTGAFSTAQSAEPSDVVRLAATSPRAVADHSAWDRLLKTYVKPGLDGLNRVDYSAFKSAGHDDLRHYIQRMERIDPHSLIRSEQFALLANLYNAKTISIVLDRYPVKSIRDISLGNGRFAAFSRGPWKAKVLTIRGLQLSLDDIEHGILRSVFKDPRVHYAVNCASVGCPNLPTEALVGAKLNSQLDAGARTYVNHPRGATLINGKLVVSSIYDWFKSDFGDNGVLAHLRTYALPALAAKLEGAMSIGGYQYDWNLNDVRQ